MDTKENYGWLDNFRLAAAVLVIAIHTSPLTTFSAEGDFFFTRILARIAVPFFLMVTGQFVVGRFTEESARSDASLFPVGQLQKLLLLYALSIVLYLPIGIYAGHYRGLTFGGALRMLLFDGTFYHLWYFPACLLGIALVYLMSRFFGLKGMLACSFVLYCIGLLGDSYFGLVQMLPALKAFYEFLFGFSSYTRNGLFFAPLFLTLGACFGAEYRPSGSCRTNILGLAVSFLLMTGEAFTLRFFSWQRHDSMYLMLIPVMIFLYRTLLCLKGTPGKLFRSAALWIYVLHPAFIVVLRGAAKLLHLTALLVDNSLIHFLAVCALSVPAGFLAAAIQAKLSPKMRSLFPALCRPTLPSSRGRAWIELDRKALAQNVSYLTSLLPEGCRLMPAVKANAYGHGAVLIARELNRLGVDAFCVACLQEGIQLRRAKVKGEILILGYTDPEDFPLLARHRLTQTVLDYEYAGKLEQSGIKLHVHIGIDTGMHRLGIRCENIEEILSVFDMKNLTVDGMFTHLSACDSPESESRVFTECQIQAFYRVAEILEEQGIPCPLLHLQSTYGLLNYPHCDADYVRVGIALYGVPSVGGGASFFDGHLRPILSLKARVASVRNLRPGESAGYSLAFTAEKDMRIAVLSIGYADGLPRELSCGGGSALLCDAKVPIIGKICMDQTLVDVSDVPQVQAGDIAILIGSSETAEITAAEAAAQCGTITNELLSRLGERLKRFFSISTPHK